MKWQGWAVITAVVAVGAVSFAGFRAAIRGGEFTTLTPRFEGQCVNRPGAIGAEDMVADRERRLLYVSSDDRRAARASGQAAPRGRLLALSLDNPDPAAPAFVVEDGLPGGFHPHGVDLWVGPDGARTLMVVNHPQSPSYKGSTIEIFDVAADGRLTHRRTVAGDWLHRPNDVAAVGPNQFYVTNEGAADAGSFGDMVGLMLGTDTSGTVWYFDGTEGREVATGLTFANSVAADRNSRRVYATSTVGRAVYVYDRDEQTGALNRVDAAFVGTGVDNIDIDPEGRLWIGTHPKMMTFSLGHARDPAKPSPSQVIIVEPDPKGAGGVVDQVYLSDGTEFPGVAVAVRDGNRMIMGAVFADGIRVCELPPVWKHSEAAPARRLVDPLRDEKMKADAAASAAASGAP